MTDKEKLLKGKVARILNSKELVINIGEKDAVEIGMIFDVLDPKGEEIKDPDTKKILGSLQRPKVRVKVIEVQKNLSVASTYRKKEVNVGGTGRSWQDLSKISLLLMPEKWMTVQETLKTKEKTWEDLDEKESFVKTGDPIIQVLIDDEET